jgi:hypothetical protein
MGMRNRITQNKPIDPLPAPVIHDAAIKNSIEEKFEIVNIKPTYNFSKIEIQKDEALAAIPNIKLEKTGNKLKTGKYCLLSDGSVIETDCDEYKETVGDGVSYKLKENVIFDKDVGKFFKLVEKIQPIKENEDLGIKMETKNIGDLPTKLSIWQKLKNLIFKE